MSNVMIVSKKLLLIILCIHFSVIVYAQNTTGTLAENHYSDSNGYFKIVPPATWRIQTYPQDPRGKVAFVGPTGVELRVLAKGLDYNSFEDMLEEIKGIERNIGTNTNIEVITFCNTQAVKRRFTYKGLKMLFIDFMLGNTTHNLMYSAPPDKYNNYESIVWDSICTYEPTLRGVSSEVVKKHAIASSLRLSQLFIEQNNYVLASVYAKQGLEIDPNHPELLQLKQKIDEKGISENALLDSNTFVENDPNYDQDILDRNRLLNENSSEDTSKNTWMVFLILIIIVFVLFCVIAGILGIFIANKEK